MDVHTQLAMSAIAAKTVIRSWKDEGLRIGFVPTMGALHAGHLALVSHAKSICDRVVVSIFVNPKQFAPTEDLARYPRQEDKDIKALQSVGCDLVYLPQADSFYPNGFSSEIKLGGPALGLESDFRPHFFAGVCTVVAKLFNQISPDCAVFGEKDFQQLCVIKAMVRDLDMGIEIIGHPTLREANGLALSSRNAYLSDDERTIAPKLKARLDQAKSAIRHGADVDLVLKDMRERLIEDGFARIDYLTLRDSDTLGPVGADTQERRLLAALWLGQTRLIDNIDV